MRSICVALFAALLPSVQGNGPPPPGPICKDCPNIVLMITDDQDEVIGGWDNMKQTKEKVQHKGVIATEWRIHTPICGPSRGQLQSGRYLPNIASREKTPSPKVSGGAVNQIDLGGKVWPYFFAKTLREQKGYVTGLFGKCMNGGCGVNLEGGYNTKPESNPHLDGVFDRWFEGVGYINASFYDNEADGCDWPWTKEKCQTQTFEGGAWAGKGDGYVTSTIGNITVQWLQKISAESERRPFFMYFAPEAPHSPATPAPWYEKGTICDNIIAPRIPNWNYSGAARTSCSKAPPEGSVKWWNGTDFHELVSCQPYFDAEDVQEIDDLAQKRCKTLLSVDDSYAQIIKTLEDLQLMNNTYFMVTSDHGYNLGHHMLPSNKFLLYEHSLKIPMLFSGPGIEKNGTFNTMGTQVDLAPTILGLAGIDTPGYMDGRSMVPMLITDGDVRLPGSVERHLKTAVKFSRTSTFHGYYNQGPWEVGTRHPLDDWSNTYIGVTYKGGEGDFKYAMYDPFGKQTNFTKPYMYELFNLRTDPFELHNIYNSTLASDPGLVQMLTDLTFKWYHCSGTSCQ
eukprot:TRINITY_DN4663_c0_g3_i2.p1 TRINITY_DN4663_c0_g3~~TRINITY_DN4663_c0_g3_i2.p1  ORF type:complete len:589 (+),score=70.13 TRINITY_DN4663_c0_g3_i2:70-1767(+)